MKLNIKVKPSSKNQEIKKLKDNIYQINLKSKPEDNKANIELIKLLKKHFKKEAEHIKIIKGLKSKNKIIEIKN